MSKKSIKSIVTVVALVFLLTGCSTATSEITTSTTFQEMMSEGFFAAIITYPIAQVINFLTPNIGIALAITVVTLAINAIVLVFTFKSSVGMQKMQEIQPEIQKIQAKYEGRTDQASQQRMAMEMQSIYQKYDVNPIGSLVSSFIQLPILLGMYNAVRRSTAVINSTFLGVSLSTTPKEAFKAFNIVCIVIYVLMIGFQFLSIKCPQWIAEYRGKKEADKHHKSYQKPQQQQSVAMTYGMLLMIAFVMLGWPTALSLYYVIYSIVNILKTIIIDKMTHKD